MSIQKVIDRLQENLEQDPENKTLNIITSKVINKFQNFKENLEKYENEGELIKKELSDLKSDFNRSLDNILSKRDRKYFDTDEFKQRYIDNKDTEAEYLIRSNLIGSNGIKKALRELKKYENSVDGSLKNSLVELRDILEEFDGYNDRIKILAKEKVVSKKKAKVDKEKEEAKIASHADVIKVKQHISDLVLSIKDETVNKLKNSVLFQYQRVIEALKSDNLEVKTKTLKSRDEKENMPNQFKFSYQEQADVSTIEFINGKHVFKIKDKLELHSLAQKEAEEAFEHMRKFYSHRVSSKLALILNHKDNLESIKTNKLNSKDGAIESYLTVYFKDKSQFELSTNVEWSTLPSDWSKQFMRVPTRFHNAITSNGEKHTNLSEKFIQDLFIKKNESNNIPKQNKGNQLKF